jgi:hypothetical protein
MLVMAAVVSSGVEERRAESQAARREIQDRNRWQRQSRWDRNVVEHRGELGI